MALVHLHRAREVSSRDVSLLKPRDTNKSPSAVLLKIAIDVAAYWWWTQLWVELLCCCW